MADDAATVARSGEEIHINGDISPTTAKEFSSMMAEGGISRVVVHDSSGGDVDSAIDMALLIYEEKLDVEIRGICLSSCANYLFPAGFQKYVVDKGLVAWHGDGAHMMESMRAEGQHVLYLRSFQKTISREKLFFQTIGVDQRLCSFAKRDPYAVGYYYYLDQDDMEYFGIKNIHLRKDYSAAAVGGELAPLQKFITYVKVDRALTPSDFQY